MPATFTMTVLSRVFSRDPEKFTRWANKKAGRQIPNLTKTEHVLISVWRRTMNEKFEKGKVRL